MARVLGIDYGEKRVGLALSDPAGRLAAPYQVLPRDARLVGRLAEICRREGVERIVLGESKNLSGAPNPVQKQIEKFRAALAVATSLPIFYQPEFFTSAAAERAGGKDSELDARAAALILQTYLDRQHSSLA